MYVYIYLFVYLCIYFLFTYTYAYTSTRIKYIYRYRYNIDIDCYRHSFLFFTYNYIYIYIYIHINICVYTLHIHPHFLLLPQLTRFSERCRSVCQLCVGRIASSWCRPWRGRSVVKPNYGKIISVIPQWRPKKYQHSTLDNFPMDPSTFLGSVWGIIYYNLEA